MKIVIDISDEEYEDVKKTGGCYYDFGKAIYYGTPLDKIRDEMEEHRRKTQYIDPYDLVGDCLNIIDQYRAESEDKKKLSWLGKRCEDCGNKKCKELGELPKGYDCALWQAESEG